MLRRDHGRLWSKVCRAGKREDDESGANVILQYRYTVEGCADTQTDVRVVFLYKYVVVAANPCHMHHLFFSSSCSER